MKRSFGYALAAVVAIVLVISAALSLLPPREARKVAGPPPPQLSRLIVSSGAAPDDTTFKDSGGNDISLADFGGKGLVVNLWATWCAPCVEELPALDRLSASLEGTGVEVLPVSLDREGRAVVEPFLDRLGIERLASAYDQPMLLNLSLGVRGLPTTVLIDSQGLMVGRLEGIVDWDDPAVRDWLVARLAPR